MLGVKDLLTLADLAHDAGERLLEQRCRDEAYTLMHPGAAQPQDASEKPMTVNDWHLISQACMIAASRRAATGNEHKYVMLIAKSIWRRDQLKKGIVAP